MMTTRTITKRDTTQHLENDATRSNERNHKSDLFEEITCCKIYSSTNIIVYIAYKRSADIYESMDCLHSILYDIYSK